MVSLADQIPADDHAFIRIPETSPNAKMIWGTGAALIATGVIAGGFGSPTLQRRLTPPELRTWQTASLFAISNGAVLLGLSRHTSCAVDQFAAPAIAIGTLIFSGSIFSMGINRDRFKFMGPVTPVGGVITLAGWIALWF